MSTSLAIDCSQLGYRSFYSFRDDLSFENEQVGVVYGFLSQVFKIAKAFQTKEIAFCWDSKESARKEIFPTYKEKRAEASKEQEDADVLPKKVFYKQMNLLRTEILPALGFKNSFMFDGFEADDIIALLVNRYDPFYFTVVSSDNDLWQLLDRCVIYDPRTNKRFIAEDLRKLYGVSPKGWLKVKCLAGCKGDEVPGVKGTGIPTAIKYLKGDLKKGKVLDRIKSPKGMKIAIRNHKLIKLPFKERLIRLNKLEEFKKKEWIEVFDKYNFRSFLKKSYFRGIQENFFPLEIK